MNDIQYHAALVGEWLTRDSRGFKIPDSEWGRELFVALTRLVAHVADTERLRDANADAARLLGVLASIRYTPGQVGPTGGDGYIRGTWDDIERAYARGLLSDKEYSTIAVSAPSVRRIEGGSSGWDKCSSGPHWHEAASPAVAVHEMIPPNVNGQYTCKACKEPWPCREGRDDVD